MSALFDQTRTRSAKQHWFDPVSNIVKSIGFPILMDNITFNHRLWLGCTTLLHMINHWNSFSLLGVICHYKDIVMCTDKIKLGRASAFAQNSTSTLKWCFKRAHAFQFRDKCQHCIDLRVHTQWAWLMWTVSEFDCPSSPTGLNLHWAISKCSRAHTTAKQATVIDGELCTQAQLAHILKWTIPDHKWTMLRTTSSKWSWAPYT